MDKIIIPIGGGNLDSNLNINKYILSLVNDKANVLFIPIASGDNIDYVNRFKDHFEKLGANVDVLYLQNNVNDNQVRTKIFRSNIIYIGGGNTAKMMRIFKRTNVNKYLLDAYDRGIILTGISAGGMAYFSSGYSDSNRMINPEASLTKVNCLGIIPLCFCPHYNEDDRKGFKDFLILKNLVGLSLDDDTAIVFKNGIIDHVISDNNGKCYYFENENIKEIL